MFKIWFSILCYFSTNEFFTLEEAKAAAQGYGLDSIVYDPSGEAVVSWSSIGAFRTMDLKGWSYPAGTLQS